MSKIYKVLSKMNQDGDESDNIQKTAISDGHNNILRLPQLYIDSLNGAQDEFECLYRNILILGEGNVKSVMVCSSDRGEGTTSVAMNLACYVAIKKNVSTLLMEANFNNPTFFKYRNGKGSEGLYELLLQQGPLQNYVMGSSVPKLSVIGAGRLTNMSKEAFTPSRIESAIHECKSHYPFVVVDAAPIINSNESLELAKHIDGVVLVVKSYTLAEKVQEAKTALDHVQTKILGVVLKR